VYEISNTLLLAVSLILMDHPPDNQSQLSGSSDSEFRRYADLPRRQLVPTIMQFARPTIYPILAAVVIHMSSSYYKKRTSVYPAPDRASSRVNLLRNTGLDRVNLLNCLPLRQFLVPPVPPSVTIQQRSNNTRSLTSQVRGSSSQCRGRGATRW